MRLSLVSSREQLSPGVLHRRCVFQRIFAGACLSCDGADNSRGARGTREVGIEAAVARPHRDVRVGASACHMPHDRSEKIMRLI